MFPTVLSLYIETEKDSFYSMVVTRNTQTQYNSGLAPEIRKPISILSREDRTGAKQWTTIWKQMKANNKLKLNTNEEEEEEEDVRDDHDDDEED